MKKPPARTYLYDAFGNMLENGSHDLTHGGDTGSFSQMNRLPYSLGAVYDPAGNLTAFGHHGYSYDPFNRMVHYEHEVPNEARTGWDVDADYDYWYDVDGERLGKCRRINDLDPETTYEEFTLYLRDESGNVMTEFTYPACPAETTPLSAQQAFWDWRRDHAYFSGKQIATVKFDPKYEMGAGECEPNNSAYDIFLHHKDHLGTLRVVTKWRDGLPGSGNEFELFKSFHAYWPYGEEITNQTQDDLTHRYTGHERDFESNLDYMHARYYSQFQGRFLSPDKINKFQTKFPQTFNLYSYSMNNPVNFVDLSGFADQYFVSIQSGMGLGLTKKSPAVPKDTSKVDVSRNRWASKSEILNQLSSAPANSATVIWAHNVLDPGQSERRLKTDEYFVSSARISGSDLQSAIASNPNASKMAVAVFGCSSAQYVDSAIQGGAGIAVGFKSATGTTGTVVGRQAAEVFINSLTTALENGDSLEDAVNKAAEETTKFLQVQASDKDFTELVVDTQSSDTSSNTGN